MSEKLFDDNIKLILIILLHIVLYFGGYLMVDVADEGSLAAIVGVLMMALFSIMLPLYLLSRWMVQWRTLKLAVVLFFVSDVAINIIPYLHFVDADMDAETGIGFFLTLTKMFKAGVFTYGLAYYLIVRQERKLIKDSQTGYYNEENN